MGSLAAWNLEAGEWHALYGWPAVSLTEDPTVTPSTGPEFFENGVGPRNGFTIHIGSADCSPGHTAVVLHRFDDFVERRVT